jgi:phospholipase A-2-activating protein
VVKIVPSVSGTVRRLTFQKSHPPTVNRVIRYFPDGDCSQTIVHPAISVWTVSTMPNGDIVSGCSDGIVRVFSAAEERWACQEDLKDYEKQVASQALPAQQIGDVKKTDLPGPEALATPGTIQFCSIPYQY